MGRCRAALPYIRRAVVVLGVAAIFWFVPSGYVLNMPGSAIDVAPMIIIEGEEYSGQQGVMLTTVFTREANLAVAMFGLAYPRAELRPRSLYLQEGEDFEEYFERTKQMMLESQNVAKYVALREVGLEARIDGDGVEVVSVTEDSPARGTLFPGDVIIAAGGVDTAITDDLLSVVASRSPGDRLELLFEREGQRHEAVVLLMAADDDPNRPLIGIGVVTRDPIYVFPRDIDIDAGTIGGPSAGLAFTLELIDRLLPERSLLSGLRVACTGTVNTRGEVGSVGGVAMKVWAASRAGADLFIVPRSNYSDALEAGADLEIVPVDTVEDAVEAVRGRSARRLGDELRPAA